MTLQEEVNHQRCFPEFQITFFQHFSRLLGLKKPSCMFAPTMLATLPQAQPSWGKWMAQEQFWILNTFFEGCLKSHSNENPSTASLQSYLVRPCSSYFVSSWPFCWKPTRPWSAQAGFKDVRYPYAFALYIWRGILLAAARQLVHVHRCYAKAPSGGFMVYQVQMPCTWLQMISTSTVLIQPSSHKFEVLEVLLISVLAGRWLLALKALGKLDLEVGLEMEDGILFKHWYIDITQIYHFKKLSLWILYIHTACTNHRHTDTMIQWHFFVVFHSWSL